MRNRAEIAASLYMRFKLELKTKLAFKKMRHKLPKNRT